MGWAETMFRADKYVTLRTASHPMSSQPIPSPWPLISIRHGVALLASSTRADYDNNNNTAIHGCT